MGGSSSRFSFSVFVWFNRVWWEVVWRRCRITGGTLARCTASKIETACPSKAALCRSRLITAGAFGVLSLPRFLPLPQNVIPYTSFPAGLLLVIKFVVVVMICGGWLLLLGYRRVRQSDTKRDFQYREFLSATARCLLWYHLIHIRSVLHYTTDH